MIMNHASLRGQADDVRRWLRFDPATRGFWDVLLLRGVDGLLAATVLSVPLLAGGCQALGQCVLVALALAVAACWCIRQALTGQTHWIWSSAEYLLLAAVVLVAFQWIPLPSAVIGILSPHLYESLPLWSPAAAPSARLGVWSCLSLAPAETSGGLPILGAYALLFLVTVQRIRETDDVERLLRYVAIAGAGMAALGLVPYLAGPGNYFWCYDHPLNTATGTIRGSFPNHDYFAHFLVLTLGPLVWWLQNSLTKDPTWRSGWHWHSGRALRRGGTNVGLLAAALGLGVFAVVLSRSSGSIAVMFLAAAACLVILYRGELLESKTFLLLLGAGLLLAVSLGLYRYQLTAAQPDGIQPSRRLWRTDLTAAAEYRWLGTGLGSHAQVQAVYLPDDQASPSLPYTQGEPGYLRVAMEMGFAGLLLVTVAIVLVGYWCLAVWHPGIFQRELLCFAGIIPCLLASLLQAAVDPVWSVPGCMVLVVLLAACACRLAQLVRCNDRPPVVQARRAAWLLAAPVLLVVACLVGPGLIGAVIAEPSWHRALAQGRNLSQRSATDQGVDLTAMVRDLSQVVAWQPDHALAHARLTEAHLRLFQQAQGPNGLDARHVRDAAMASQFASREALDVWLTTAFGPKREHLDQAFEHARLAVTLCPVQGAMYLRLAALTFLAGPEALSKDLCLQQAFQARPQDGNVLFEIGQEAHLAGDSQQAFAFWQRSFQAGPRHQERLIRLLADQMSADAFMDVFPLDLPAFARLEARYRQLRRTDDLTAALTAHAQAAGRSAARLTDEAAVSAWLEAAHAYRELGDVDACVASLQQALSWDTANYDIHYTLGSCLFQAKRYADAEKHLAWCRQRRRHDETLRAMVDTIATQGFHLTRQPAFSGAN